MMLEAKQNTSNRALAVPEIVELVLLHLDMRTILTSAQRTCQTWRYVVQSFPSIQKHLFFKPILRQQAERIINPLLIETFPSFFPSGNQEFSPTSLDIFNNPHKAEAYIREEASWRRMLLLQPPISSLALFQLHSIPVDPPMSSPHNILVCLEPGVDLSAHPVLN